MKKRFTAVTVTALVCWMIITSPAWAQTVNDLKIGDADGDGKSDINDALAVALYDCGMKIQNDMAGFTMADADCSGKVDIFDALKIAEFDAGIVQTLDCSGCVEPSAPVGPGAVETEDMTSVNISWNAVPWAASYRLYRDTSSDGSFTEEIYAGSDTSYNDSADSECGINCYYRVLAENTCGQSAKSDYASVESYSACYALSAPGGLRASATGQTSVKINWNFVGLASSYRLYRDTSATGSFSSKIYEGTALSYTDTNLQCGTAYYYKVSAVNICFMEYRKSDYVSAATSSCCTKPSVPGGLSAAVITGAASVNISWSAVSGAAGYRLYRDTSATGSFTQEIYSGSGTSYTDSTGLNYGTTYYYKVLAENSCGQSAKSASVSAEILPRPSDELSTGIVIIEGLVWLKNFNCIDDQPGLCDYPCSKGKIAELKSGMCGLTDNSVAGEWRLPTKDELLTVYKYKSAFSPGLYDFIGWYWSSTFITPYSGSNYRAPVTVSMSNGLTDWASETNPYYHIWPVRSLRPWK